MSTLEKQIENEILAWLTYCGALVWKNQSVGIFDPVKKIYRKSRNPYHRNGVADILGIWDGVPLAVEVKTKAGKLTANQVRFLEDFKAAGGIAFVARSIADVVRELSSYTFPRAQFRAGGETRLVTDDKPMTPPARSSRGKFAQKPKRSKRSV